MVKKAKLGRKPKPVGERVRTRQICLPPAISDALDAAVKHQEIPASQIIAQALESHLKRVKKA